MIVRSRIPNLGSLVAIALGIAVPLSAAPDVAPTAEDICPISIGSTLPEALIKTVDGGAATLRDYLSGGPGVLIVYRGGWCPFCSSQLADLQQVVDPIRELGLRLFAMSGDTPERLLPGDEDDDPPFTMLSDIDLHASKALGLAFHVSDAYVTKLAEYELDTEGNAVSTEQILPVPAVFVFDAEGTITFSYVNPDYRVRCDPEVLLAAARVVVRTE